MPKTFIISKNEPNMMKAQDVELITDEAILDSIRSKIDKTSEILLLETISPQDDFVIFNKDTEKLKIEVQKVLTSNKNLANAEIVFLYMLIGVCNACIETNNNLFGFAD